MEQIEIIEGNRLIAEFHGWTHVQTPKDKGKGYWNFPLWRKASWDADSFQYHSSWDWLLPAVKKAKDYLDKMERPSKNHCCKGDLIEVDVQCHLWSIDLENTWKSFIEWITWHNSQTPNK